MSYSGRKRYKTRREKNELMAKRMKGVVIIAFLAMIVYCIKNRVALWDYIQTYFY